MSRYFRTELERARKSSYLPPRSCFMSQARRKRRSIMTPFETLHLLAETAKEVNLVNGRRMSRQLNPARSFGIISLPWSQIR